MARAAGGSSLGERDPLILRLAAALVATLTALLTLAIAATIVLFAAYMTWAYFDNRRFEKCVEEHGGRVETASASCGR